MTLAPDTGNDLAVLNLVRTDARAEPPHRLAEDLTEGELILNLRAEGDPERAEGRWRWPASTSRRASWASPRPSSTSSTSGRAGLEPTHRMADAMSSQAPRILYCHCAFAKVVAPDVKAAVLNGLSDADVEFDAVPDLCEMAARGDPRLRELAAEGPLRIAACYPRAVKWLFASAGAPLPEDACASGTCAWRPAAAVIDGLAAADAGRPDVVRGAHAVSIARFADRARCSRCCAAVTPAIARHDAPADRAALAQSLLERGVEASAVPPRSSESVRHRTASTRRPRPRLAAGRAASLRPMQAWKPWFPVIDYSRCTNCMQCLSFCLFDVYGVSADSKIQVQNQSNCKTDCPACSRVCPEVAIMFPKYRHGPINGEEVTADDVRREAMKVDISALLGGDIYSMLRDRSVKAKSRFSKERDDERALKERQTCLVALQGDLDMPAEVLAALPSPEEIMAKAEAARAARPGSRPGRRSSQKSAKA